jgi:hypothetical protein
MGKHVLKALQQLPSFPWTIFLSLALLMTSLLLLIIITFIIIIFIFRRHFTESKGKEKVRLAGNESEFVKTLQLELEEMKTKLTLADSAAKKGGEVS